MSRTEILTCIASIVMLSRAEWRWRKDQIKIAVALHGPTNILNYDDLGLEEIRDRRMVKVMDRAGRREQHLLSGSGRRFKWSWFHRS
jgi:hypothetical protein